MVRVIAPESCGNEIYQGSIQGNRHRPGACPLSSNFCNERLAVMFDKQPLSTPAPLIPFSNIVATGKPFLHVSSLNADGRRCDIRVLRRVRMTTKSHL